MAKPSLAPDEDQMVKILLLLLLFPMSASAIWLEDLFGQPPAGYFAVSYQKLYQWGTEKLEGQGQALQKKHKEFLLECLKGANDWYFQPEYRLQRFAFSLKHNQKTKKISYEFLCAPKNEKILETLLTSELRKNFALPTGEKILAARIGASGVIELYSAAKLFRLDATGQAEMISLQPYKKPGLDTGPLPYSFLVQEYSPKPKGEYFLELKAYLDSVLPEELQNEVKAIHLEFGFIADSIETFSDSSVRVSFP